MKVCIIAKALELHRRGGFETHVTQLAECLARLGNDVHVVCRRLPRISRAKYSFVLHDVKFVRTGIEIIDNYTSVFPFARCLKSLFEKNDFDIVHGHGISSVAYPLSVRLGGKKMPFVYTLHGIASRHLVGYKQPYRAVLKLMFDMERFSVKRADKLICVSKSTIDDAVKYYSIARDKCVYIPNGADVKRFMLKRKKRKPRTVGFVGFLHERKGVQCLVEGFAGVVKCYPDARLVIIGRGPMLEKLKMQAENLGIQKNLAFLSHVSDKELVQCYSEMDILALPSLYEGFGIVAVEALASGMPVIVTDAGDLAAIAKSAGIVINPGARQVEAAILRLFSDSRLYSRLKSNARKRAAEFDWMNIARKTEKLYNEVLQRQDF